MLIRKAYRYKLKTTPEIEQRCLMMAGCCRLVWNKALALNLYRLENKQPVLWYNELAFWLEFWKNTDELTFLKETHSQPLQQTLKNPDRAFKDAFDKEQPNKRIPKFKRRGKNDSFRYPQGFNIEGNRIYLPKIGWVRYFNRRKIVGMPKNVTVKREAGGWYISIQVEQEIVSPQHPSTSIVGVDRGITQLAVTSDGAFYAPTNSFRRYQDKLAREQRKLENKKKFSANWKKQQCKISGIHHSIANIRKDRLHWVSDRISKNHAIVVLEDLKVSNMSKSAKGTADAPGKNVKAKSGLNKSILDQGWSMFADMLEYKQTWRGGELFFVPPHHTSQTCPGPACQHRSPENRTTQSKFKCVLCGYTDNADLVGAINVLERGHRLLACGELALADSTKQEPKAA